MAWKVSILNGCGGPGYASDILCIIRLETFN